MLKLIDLKEPPKVTNVDKFDEIILVDVSQVRPLEGKVPTEKVFQIIDHRKTHEAEKFPNAKAQIELVGAAATLIAEKFIKENIRISKKSAMLLYAAIISNTCNFKGISTPKDEKAAIWLNKVANLPENFAGQLFEAKSDLSGVKLDKRLEEDFAWFILKNKKVGIAQIEALNLQKIIKLREEGIITKLTKFKRRFRLDLILLNGIDLGKYICIFVTKEAKTKILFEKVFKVRFTGNTAQTKKIIMRKQIGPFLEKFME